MKPNNRRTVSTLGIVFIGISLMLSGCASTTADLLNPYAEDGGSGYGQRDSGAILGSAGGSASEDNARHALEVMKSYRRTQSPQPAYPVIQPAEVRLMWIPDHLNKAGDMVSAHYYFLKVLPDRWNLQDAFELENQLKGDSAGSAMPWVYQE